MDIQEAKHNKKESNMNKQIEFYKSRLIEKISEIKDSISNTKYKLYIAMINDCNSFEEITELAEIDLQLEMFKYMTNLKNKLAEYNTSIDEIHEVLNSNTRSARLVIISPSKNNSNTISGNEIKSMLMDEDVVSKAIELGSIEKQREKEEQEEQDNLLALYEEQELLEEELEDEQDDTNYASALAIELSSMLSSLDDISGINSNIEENKKEKLVLDFSNNDANEDILSTDTEKENSLLEDDYDEDEITDDDLELFEEESEYSSEDYIDNLEDGYDEDEITDEDLELFEEESDYSNNYNDDFDEDDEDEITDEDLESLNEEYESDLEDDYDEDEITDEDLELFEEEYEEDDYDENDYDEDEITDEDLESFNEDDYDEDEITDEDLELFEEETDESDYDDFEEDDYDEDEITDDDLESMNSIEDEEEYLEEEDEEDEITDEDMQSISDEDDLYSEFNRILSENSNESCDIDDLELQPSSHNSYDEFDSLFGDCNSKNKGTVNIQNRQMTVKKVFLNGTDRGRRTQQTFNMLNKIINFTGKNTKKALDKTIEHVNKSDMYNIK